MSRLDQFGSVHRSAPSWFGETALRLVAFPLLRARARFGGVGRWLLHALLVLLHEGQELLHGVFAEFGSWPIMGQGRQAGRAHRNSQDDAIISAQEDMRHVLRRTRNAFNTETFTK